MISVPEVILSRFRKDCRVIGLNNIYQLPKHHALHAQRDEQRSFDRLLRLFVNNIASRHFYRDLPHNRYQLFNNVDKLVWLRCPLAT